MLHKKTKLAAVLIFLIAGTGSLFAQSLEETVALHGQAIDMIWLILSAALVFFMQAGFAMVETGLTRAKNSANVLMKNLMDFSVGSIAFWAIGWALMYGADALGLIGTDAFFLHYNAEGLAAYGAGSMSDIYRDWMFQVVFAGTASTIVSGAMAERTRFASYLIYSVFITALIYPVSGHWVWGGGWLSSLGFHDFAGSTVVHSVGGWAALAGAIVLGARKGKYIRTPEGIKVKAIPGHNLPIAALGVFILWFGWYGFNAGSTLSGSDLSIGHIAVTTTLAAGAGSVGAMIFSWILYKKPDPSMSLNGALAGLVGITAGTWVIGPGSSIVVGFIAGILVILSVEFIDKVLHVDDPVGAISVHGVCGAWGTLAVGLFANGVNDSSIVGLFFGGGLRQLGVQALGIISAFAWSFGTALILFLIIRYTVGLRVSEEEELKGLDISEHSIESYSGFQIFSNM
ncbi:ammonium transporter [Spirochaetia bacterium 38H-sp]|uniref:Ammonium transporter n=1 Tax=Rarispira pelagica TaxID=3141764 RepID=A0ABU9UDH2_9SPIR